MSGAAFGHELIRASAGSGKTFRLTNRYLGLLADSVEPGAILATTFTRKAAGEILDRVLQRLATAAGNAAKARELAEQLGRGPCTAEDCVALLRRLLPNLHRVRIGTLDSFFMALAGSFSLELGLPPGWSICEPVDEIRLQSDALERLLEQHPEDIGKLLPLLSKGEIKRSIHNELRSVIDDHSDIFRESSRAAWESLQVPAPVDKEDIAAALEQLREFDFSRCGHKSFQTAQQADLARFDRQNWQEFLGTGMAAKVAEGQTTFYKKPIPPDALLCYGALVQHARAEILQRLAGQNRATWDLLQRFHGELAALKQASGQLRFADVTQALAQGMAGSILRQEELGFRLDGAVEHLLLDEFQDTALAQWRVLDPMARRVTQAAAKSEGTFLCVGDVKQAIYGWRGGMAAILETLPSLLGPLQESSLDVSRRSAQPIIDVVNIVFGGLDEIDLGDKARGGLDAWQAKFQVHSTVHQEKPGYVCLHTGPAQDDASLADHRGEHCQFVASKIRDLVQQLPGRSIAVLCRKNETLARMIYELRQLDVEASEEGGNALTDSPAVELILSLFVLADHPDHSVAWFHLRNSLLKEHVAAFADAESLAADLRLELLTQGYGQFTHAWAERLAPACDLRDRSRLQQLVEMAYDYQSRSTLRADDFVDLVRDQHVPDPSGARVRVMTVHGAKGLEFDVVVLPELDASLTGKVPAFVVGRDRQSLDVTFVCRYTDEAVQKLLTAEEQDAFERNRQERVEESLSLLYVAMTRAVHALHMFIPGPRQGRSDRKDAWYKLLLAALAPHAGWNEQTLLYQHGDADWFKHVPHAPEAMVTPKAEPAKSIAFRTATTARRRGLKHQAPSHREGQARVPLDRLFHPSEGTGTAAGTLYHAWFATIAWLDDGPPSETVLRRAAEKIRVQLPAQTWSDLDQLLAKFQSWLRNPAINIVLCRSAYVNPQQPGFPTALTPFWTKTTTVQNVEQERRFLVRDGATFWNGSFDRVVWLVDGGRTVAADVLDFKTDAIAPGDYKALAERTDHYRPQLHEYRKAVARLGGLAEKRVAARLIFTGPALVAEV